MDGPQDPLEAFQDAYQVFTWRSSDGVKDLVRDTLRRSTAQSVTPADPDVIEAMIYGRRVAEVVTFFFTSDTTQAFCVRLQAERGHVEAAYQEAREAERLRLEAAAAAAAPPRPSAAYPPPALEPQGPLPPPCGGCRALAASAGLPQGPPLSGPRGGEGTLCCCPAPRGSGSGG